VGVTETAGLGSSQGFGRTEGFESNSGSQVFHQDVESPVVWIGETGKVLRSQGPYGTAFSFSGDVRSEVIDHDAISMAFVKSHQLRLTPLTFSWRISKSPGVHETEFSFSANFRNTLYAESDFPISVPLMSSDHMLQAGNGFYETGFSFSSPFFDSASVRAGVSAGVTETAGRDSSQRFGRTEGFESNSDSPFFRQGAESAVIWIGAGSAFAVIVAGTVAGVVLVLIFRRRSSRSSNQVTESEVEIDVPTESQSSVRVDPFLSEENALSVDGRPKGLNDGGEHLMAHAKDE
jgi:hypothetical protein